MRFFTDKDRPVHLGPYPLERLSRLQTAILDNVPSFQSFTYRVDDDEYFYPASTVKLPTALLALEKINEAFDLMHEGKSIRTVIHF